MTTVPDTRGRVVHCPDCGAAGAFELTARPGGLQVYVCGRCTDPAKPILELLREAAQRTADGGVSRETV